MPGTKAEEQLTDQNAGEATTQESARPTDEDLDRAWEEAAPSQEDRPAKDTAPDKGQEQEGEGGEEAKEKEGEEKKAEVDTSAEEKTESEVSAGEEDRSEQKPEHPTQLGRKVAKLSDTVSEQQKQITELLEIIRQGMSPRDKPAEERVDTEDLDLTTPEGIDRYLDLREKQKQKKVSEEVLRYQVGYKGELDKWKKDADDADETLSAEVYKSLTEDKSPFNVRYTADPKADFERNLAKAEAHFWKERAKTPPAKKNPLEGNRDKGPKAPTGVGGKTQTDPTKPAPSMKFSQDEREMISKMEWTEEEAAKFLSGSPMPMHLHPGRR